MKARYFVFHSHGVDLVRAESAAKALRSARIPAGFRDALAVMEESLVFNRRAESCFAPFVALIGTAPRK